MPFDTASLRWMTQQAFDRFSPQQRRGLANIVFMLEEADNEMRRQIGQALPVPTLTVGEHMEG